MQMKKLLGSTLALAMLFPYSQANAELLKNFKLSGQIDLQMDASRNVTDFQTRGVEITGDNDYADAGESVGNDRIGTAHTRIMVHMDWDLLDDVHSKVTLRKSDRAWGNSGGLNQGTGGAGLSQPVGADGAGTIFGSIIVDQAHFKVDKVADAADLTFGRQFFGTSGDMVIYFGPSDKALFGLPVTAIDAVRADWSNDQVGVTGLAGKTAGPVGVGAATPHAGTDVRGIVASLKGQEDLNASVYIWNQVTHAVGALGQDNNIGVVGGKNDNLWVVGLKGKYSMAGAWIAAEIAKNFGENRVADTVANLGSRRYTGWAFKGDVGYKAEVDGLGAFTPWAHLGYGTGRSRNREARNETFTPIASDYRPGSIYGRYAVAPPGAGGTALGSGLPVVAGAPAVASNSLGNRVIWGLGLKANPSAVSKLTVGLSYWDFWIQRFATGAGAPPLAGNKHIGTEVDVDLEWKHSDNVSLGAGVGTFQPGGLIKEQVQSANILGSNPNSQRGVNPVNLAYMDVRVKF